MVEFYGRYDFKSAEKMQAKKYAKMTIIVILGVAILDLVLLALYLFNIIQLMLFVAPVAFCSLIALFLAIGPKVHYLINKKKLKGKTLARITINDGYIGGCETVIKFISEYNEQDCITFDKVPFMNVAEVVDTGDSYYIIAGKSRFNSIICKKDLLVSGTIEEFEEKFTGKMKVDKNKWKNEDIRDSER